MIQKINSENTYSDIIDSMLFFQKKIIKLNINISLMGIKNLSINYIFEIIVFYISDIFL